MEHFETPHSNEILNQVDRDGVPVSDILDQWKKRALKTPSPEILETLKPMPFTQYWLACPKTMLAPFLKEFARKIGIPENDIISLNPKPFTGDIYEQLLEIAVKLKEKQSKQILIVVEGYESILEERIKKAGSDLNAMTHRFAHDINQNVGEPKMMQEAFAGLNKRIIIVYVINYSKGSEIAKLAINSVGSADFVDGLLVIDPNNILKK